MKLVPWRREDAAFPTLGSSLMQRLFDDDWLAAWPTVNRLPEAFTSNGAPAVNVAETDKEVTVTAEMPGLKEEDIDISFNGSLLTIKAERKFEEEKKEKQYHRTEIQYGTLSRTLRLPEGLNGDAIDARYKNGILTLTIPKVEPTPTRKVKVKTA